VKTQIIGHQKAPALSASRNYLAKYYIFPKENIAKHFFSQGKHAKHYIFPKENIAKYYIFPQGKHSYLLYYSPRKT